MKLFGNKRTGQHSAGADRIKVQEIRVPADAAIGEGVKQKRRRAGKRALIVVGALVLAVLIGLAIYAIWERPPEVGSTDPTATLPPAQTLAPGETAAPEDPAITPEPQDELETAAPEIAFSSEHKQGVYSVLIVGRDYASNSTDTIMLARFDTVEHTIDVVNIPRDTMVNISWSSTPKKINAVFPGFINSGKDGIEGLRTHVKNLLGFDVDCYVVVTLRAVEDAVNAIGGIYFDVPQDMDYDDGEQYFHVHLKKGYQLLNGYETLGVFRFRHTYGGGDLERIGVQQDLMKAIASQMLSLGNIPNLGEVINIIVNNVDTDLTSANIAWFARQFLQCSMDDISFSTLPVGATCLINGVSYVSINTGEWLEMVNAKLNPYQDPVTLSNVNILTSNYSGSNLQSTTGAVAGGPDSFYCQMCTSATGIAQHHAPGACPPTATAEPEISEPPTPEETPEVVIAPPEPTAPADWEGLLPDAAAQTPIE